MTRRRPEVRLFSALVPPEGIAERLTQWSRSWLARPAIRRVAGEQLHLTLSFLGERPVEEIDPLCEALEDYEAAAPVLAIGAPVLLPRRAPRTVAVEVIDNDGTLAVLQSGLAAALAAVSSWEPSRRRFHPHITVARMPAGTKLEAPPPSPDIEFLPAAVELVRSRLEPAGAKYETLAQRLLKAA